MPTDLLARPLRALVALACVACAPLSTPVLGATAMPDGSWRLASGTAAPVAARPTPVHGLLLRLRDAPDHAAATGAAIESARRHALVARSDARWHALLKTSRLGATPGLRLQPVGRNAWRVLFDGDSSPATVARWVGTLSQRADVQWVVPNERETALQAELPHPDDPEFGALSDQWWLLPVSGSNANAIDARLRGVPGFQSAWARTTGSAGTVVAVLDSGIAAHPDVDTARLLPGYDMVSDWDAATGRGYANDGDGRDADPTDPGDWVDAADQAADAGRYAGCELAASDWHGTAVAGFLAAATGNGRGVAAATWSGRVLPVRVAGKCGAEVADIVDGMRWAAGLRVCSQYAVADDASQGCASWAPVNPTPARIVNISFGGTAACNAAYQDAIDELHALGVVVVAAGGNGHGAPTRPASCTGVVGVAAVNRDGFKAVYSNFGSVLEIATVGGDTTGGAWGGLLADSGLQSLGNVGDTTAGAASYPHYYGTSFAAPIVAGAAALMLAADPALDADEIIAGLRESARPHATSPTLPTCGALAPGRCACTSATCGAGILDADQAVAWAQARARGGRVRATELGDAGDRQRRGLARRRARPRPGGQHAGGFVGGDVGRQRDAGRGGRGAMDGASLLALLALAGLLGGRPPLRRFFRATRSAPGRR